MSIYLLADRVDDLIKSGALYAVFFHYLLSIFARPGSVPLVASCRDKTILPGAKLDAL